MDDHPEHSQRPLRPEMQAVLADLKAGVTYREAVEKHGLTYWQVRMIAANAGIRRKGRDHRTPKRES